MGCPSTPPFLQGGWAGTLLFPHPCVPVGFLPHPLPPLPAISAFCPLLRGQPKRAGVGPPQPAGWGFPSTEPSSPGFIKQIAHMCACMCVLQEKYQSVAILCMCFSLFSHLGKGP